MDKRMQVKGFEQMKERLSSVLGVIFVLGIFLLCIFGTFRFFEQWYRTNESFSHARYVLTQGTIVAVFSQKCPEYHSSDLLTRSFSGETECLEDSYFVSFFQNDRPVQTMYNDGLVDTRESNVPPAYHKNQRVMLYYDANISYPAVYEDQDSLDSVYKLDPNTLEPIIERALLLLAPLSLSLICLLIAGVTLLILVGRLYLGVLPAFYSERE